MSISGKQIPCCFLAIYLLVGCVAHPAAQPGDASPAFPRESLLGETDKAAAVCFSHNGVNCGVFSKDWKSAIVGSLDENNLPMLNLMGPEAMIGLGFQDKKADSPAIRLGVPQGVPRAVLGVEKGEGVLSLMAGSEAPKHTNIARLGFCDAQPALLLRSGEGTGQVLALVDKDGSPRIELKDAKGRPRVVIGLGPDGAGFLRFLDEEGNPATPAP